MLRLRVCSNCARRRIWTRLVQDRTGVTAIEYGLIASLVAAALVVGLATAGPTLQTVFASVSAAIQQVLEYI